MKLPHCPQCKTNSVRRVARLGLFEILAGLLYRYPFRCDCCKHRFYSVQWGYRYKKTAERRVNFRFPVQYRATISCAGGQTEGTMINLSAEGCAMKAFPLLPPGGVISLKIHGPEGGSLFEVQEARVRSTRGIQVGCEFLRIPDETVDNFRQLIRGLYLQQYA